MRWPPSSWPAAPADGESPFSRRRVAILATASLRSRDQRPRAGAAAGRGGGCVRASDRRPDRLTLRGWSSVACPGPPSSPRCCGPPRSSGTPRTRRLRRAASVADLRLIARRRTPRAVFDYCDGAADGEQSLRRARAAFARVEFQPSVLHDVSTIDTSRDILGKRAALPFAFAPTGFTRMMQTEGERAVASVAQEIGVPYTPVDDGHHDHRGPRRLRPRRPAVVPALPLARPRRSARTSSNAPRRRATTPSCSPWTPPSGGARLRDVRNGLSIPPALTLKTFADGAMHPNWWFDLLTTEPLHVLEPRRGRHPGRADQPGVRPRADHGRRRMAARHLAGQARDQGRAERRRRAPGGRRGRRRRAALQPRRPPARPRPRAAGAGRAHRPGVGRTGRGARRHRRHERRRHRRGRRARRLAPPSSGGPTSTG